MSTGPDSPDATRALQRVLDLKQELDLLEQRIPELRLDLGRAIAEARQAGITQADMARRLGEEREPLRRWQRAAEAADAKAAQEEADSSPPSS